MRDFFHGDLAIMGFLLADRYRYSSLLGGCVLTRSGEDSSCRQLTLLSDNFVMAHACRLSEKEHGCSDCREQRDPGQRDCGGLPLVPIPWSNQRLR
jgi:hypothetical protein